VDMSHTCYMYIGAIVSPHRTPKGSCSCVSCVSLIFSLTVPSRPIISECTGPIFSKFSGRVGMINPTFSRSLKGRCYVTDFGELAKIGILHLNSVRWHSTMDGKIAIRMYALTSPMTLLRLTKNW